MIAMEFQHGLNNNLVGKKFEIIVLIRKKKDAFNI